jgi:chlorobactene glucosyltransferase
MSFLFTTWCVVLGLVALVWVTRHLAVSAAVRDERPLSSAAYDSPPEPAPRVSVLVAAKDEEANIDTCVRTMLDQDYPDFQVIAINDRSIDQTPGIIDAVQADHPDRFTALHVTELEDGWFGKNNAMRVGMEIADGDWLLLTDADCRQISPKTITVAMRYAIEHDIDLLSLLPVLETHSFWEKVIQPVCAAIMALWFQPRNVNDPNNEAAYANGAFMLMRRELYETIGGHAKVRTEVNEDMHMARLTKAAGRRLWVMQNSDLYRTRMYASLGETWRGWSRIFYGCFGNFRRLIVSTMVLCFASLLPWVSAIVAGCGVLWGGDASSWMTPLAIATAAVVAQQSVMFRFYSLAQSNPKLTPTYVLGAVIALGMLLNAMRKLAGSTTTWRGTTYRGAQLVTPAESND